MNINLHGTVVCMGEIMLRLKPPGHDRLFQTPMLETTFGGTESNVAASLAQLGIKTRHVTAVPQNAVGDAVIGFLRGFGVDTSFVARQGERLGVYYVEAGSGPRASTVLYDRAGSSISQAKITDFDWNAIFAGASWYHVSGITPAISQAGADLTTASARMAKERGLIVSCDINYRKALWKYGKAAPDVMSKLMSLVDVAITGEEAYTEGLGIKLPPTGASLPVMDKSAAYARALFKAFPNVEIVAQTFREGYSADCNDISGMVMSRGDQKPTSSKTYKITGIVDRIGSGDAFDAGLIHGMMTGTPVPATLEFAVAAAAFKHTIPGDVNVASRAEIDRLASGESSSRIQR